MTGSSRVWSTTVEGKSVCQEFEAGGYTEPIVKEERAMDAGTSLLSELPTVHDSRSERSRKHSSLPTTANPVQLCPHMHT